MQYPDNISVYHRLASPEIRDSSLVLKSTIVSHKHQRSAARISEDIVIYDYRQGKRAEVPSWMSDVLHKANAQEHDSSEYWTRRRIEVDDMLDRLEAESIYSGKKEDMGV